MKRWTFFGMVAAIGLAMVACGGGSPTPAATSPSTPATASAQPQVRAVSDVLYQEDPDGTRHELTVFAPATEDGPWPVAVMIHGYGGGIAPEPATVAAEDVVVFAPTWPELRLVSAEAAIADWNASVERMACAVRFARAEAERYGGDPSNLSLYGHSAGANLASIVAFADPAVSDGCVARSGPVVPDNLVLFEGDWLLAGRGRLSDAWDRLLEEDPRVIDVGTPWSYLDEAARIPVHLLDSDDPTLRRAAEDTDGWLALRDPTGDFRRPLEGLGASDDGTVSFREAQRLFYDRLQDLGYDAAFHDLPDSTHDYLSEAAVQVVVDAILQRTKR